MSYKHELAWIVQQENVLSLDENKLLACIIVILVETELGILLFQVIILKQKSSFQLFVGFITPTEPSNDTPYVVQFLCGSRGSNNVNRLKRLVSAFSFLYEVWKYCYCLSKTKLLLWAVTLLFFGEK